MAFTLVSFSEKASARLPIGVVSIIAKYTDERNINRGKFIKRCLETSATFKKIEMIIGDGNCSFGRNNISAIGDFNPVIFGRAYRREVFKQVNPKNSKINSILKNLKETNNAKNIYCNQRNYFLKIILKKCKKKICKSIKYKSFDQKIITLNRGRRNIIPSLYEQIISNIDILWDY